MKGTIMETGTMVHVETDARGMGEVGRTKGMVSEVLTITTKEITHSLGTSPNLFKDRQIQTLITTPTTVVTQLKVEMIIGIVLGSVMKSLKRGGRRTAALSVVK